MKTTPKTEKEIYEANLLPPGWYPFTIGEATEKKSKAGNEMIELNVRVYKDAGFIFIRDFLMDSGFAAFKLRHCSDTCGILDQYEAGGIEACDLEGKEGFCKVTIKKDKNGQYPDQNNIADYANEPPKKKDEAKSDEPEDDIPWK